MNIEHEVKKIIIETLRLNSTPEKLDLKKSFLELGLQLDSLSGLRIVLNIEQKFNFKIKTGDLTREDFLSADNLVSFVKNKLND